MCICWGGGGGEGGACEGKTTLSGWRPLLQFPWLLSTCIY